MKVGQNGLDRYRNPRVCNNCQDPNHFIRDCPKPRNVMRNISSQVRRYPKRNQQILFELCQQVKDVLFSTDEEDPFAALTGENFKQEGSTSSEEETHEHTDK